MHDMDALVFDLIVCQHFIDDPISPLGDISDADRGTFRPSATSEHIVSQHSLITTRAAHGYIFLYANSLSRVDRRSAEPAERCRATI